MKKNNNINQKPKLLEISELYKLKDLGKKIVFNSNDIPFQDQKLILKDYYLDMKGQSEDKLFLNNSTILLNIRRGNTILEYYENDTYNRRICRKGLKKFFDIKFSDLRLENMDNEIRNLTVESVFREIDDSFSNKMEIKYYLTEKKNGENSQITFLKKFNCWLIASKNKSILLRQESEIDLYKDDQYFTVKKIARLWFLIISKLEIKEIENLKEDLNGFNLIGEYCGNLNHQTMIEELNPEIFFFAIVEIDGIETCISPSKSLIFFEKYKLNHIGIKSSIIYTKHMQNEFYEKLQEIYKEISSLSLKEHGEGYVLYFTVKNEIQEEKCVSMCKIKTLEYQIYRKIRENAKNIRPKENSPPKNLINKVEREINSLCKGLKPNREISFYNKLTIYLYENICSIPKKHFKQVINNFRLYIEKAILILESNNNQVLFDFIEEKAEKIEKKEVKTSKLLLILIPMGIPNMGKTTFLNESIIPLSTKMGFEVHSISSDAIRGELMQEYEKKNSHKKFDLDDLMEKTKKQNDTAFFDVFKQIIKKVHISSNLKQMIFVDKNHPSNAIGKTVGFVQKNVKSSINLQFVAVVPMCSFPLSTSFKDYPFSAEFVLSCLARSLYRKEHETLKGDPVKVIKIILFFVGFYAGCKFNIESLRNFGLNYIMELPFVKEDKDSVFSNEIVGSLKDILRKKEDEEHLKIFVELLKNNIEKNGEKIEEYFRIDNEFFNSEFKKNLKGICLSIGDEIDSEEVSICDEDYDNNSENNWVD